MSSEIKERRTLPLLWPCTAIALVSGSVFASQVAFSTLINILFYHDFRFVLASLALFGLGMGGIAFALARRSNAFSVERLTTSFAALYALSTVVPIFLLLWAPRWSNIPMELIVLLLLAFIHYFFAGGTIAAILLAKRQAIPLMYACDLIGAVIFGVLSIIISDLFGFSASLKLIVGMGCGAFAAVWIHFKAKGHSGLVAGAAILTLLLYFLPSHTACTDSQIQEIYDRGGLPVQDIGQVVAHASNSFSRVDLYEPPRTRSASFIVLINCAIPTGASKSNELDSVSQTLRTLPFSFLHPRRSLVLGSGAGDDVMNALRAGGEQVTAVEINPLIFKLVAKYRPELTRYPYGDPRITTVVSDGRLFAEQASEQYDMLYLAAVQNLPQTWSLQALTAHNLYTREAFDAYFDKLTADGALVIYDWRVFTQRLMPTLQAYFDDTKILSEHIMVFASTSSPRELIIAKKNSFTAEEHDAAQIAARLFERRNISHEDEERLTTDDRPFLPVFFEMPNARSDEREVRAFERSASKREFNVIWLWVCLASISFLSLVVAAFCFSERTSPRQVRSALFFVAIAFGFASFEFVIINKATLLLGNPVYAYATALTAILLSGAAGSLIAHRYRSIIRVRTWTAILSLVLIASYVGADAVSTAISLPLLPKLAVIVGMSVLPGILAGAIFPTVLQYARDESERYSLWLWGINALTFVVAGLIISVLVVKYGVKTMLLLGALSYLLAAASADLYPTSSK